MSDISPTIELTFFEGVTVQSVIELACHSAACRPPRSGGTGGSLPAGETRISTRTPTAKGAEAPIQGLTTGWESVPTEQKLAMAHRLVDSVDGFRDIKRADYKSDEEFCSAVVDRVADNVEHTFSHVSEENIGKWRNWYPGVRLLSEQWAAEYGLEPHQVAAVFASLSPGARWDDNVEMVRLVLETAVRNADVPMDAPSVRRLNKIISTMNKKAQTALVKKQEKAGEVAERATAVKSAIEAGDIASAAETFNSFKGKKPSTAFKAAAKLLQTGQVNTDGISIIERMLAAPEGDRTAIRKEAKELLGVQGYAQHLALVEVLSSKTSAYDKSMKSKAKRIAQLNPKKEIRISDLPVELAGVAVRAVAGEGRTIPRVVITAEGTPKFDGILKNDSGSDTKLRWSTAGFLADAVSITRDGSLSNISKRLGEAHKVRNFYNNITDPSDESGFTADSHAFGIAIGTPVGLSHPYIGTTGKNGQTAVSLPSKPHFASTGLKGVYALVQEGNRRATERANRRRPKDDQLILREMQSITWEQWRSDYPTEYRADKSGKGGAVSRIQEVYRQRDSGKLDYAESMRLVDLIQADVKAQEQAKLEKASKR